MQKSSSSRLIKFAWFTVAYNVFVIVWGAFVRATGSGAGCGAHWPLCNGVVIPRDPALETVIEFAHRVTSGFTLLLVAILLFQVWKMTQKRSLLRRLASAVVFFTITEALIGAGLVLFGLVGENSSTSRAISMMAHLVNTFFLMATLILTAWILTFGSPRLVRITLKRNWVTVVSYAMMLLLGASGAVTALGDTLYPVNSLAEGLQQDFASGTTLLIRLRVFHPLIAVLTGAVLVWSAWKIANRQNDRITRTMALGMTVVYSIQLLIGAINVILLAPVWIQLVHLFIALCIWLLMVLIHFLDLRQPMFSDSVIHHPVHDPVGAVSQK